MADESFESDGSKDLEYDVPYSDRPEWDDVTPIKQDDGPDPIVRIAYDPHFQDVFNYFRAVYASKEVTQRALELTTEAAELNPANYTVWHHRRFLLKELGSDVRKELEYIRGVVEDHPKNYQVWQHRRVLVEWLNDPSLELRFCEIILQHDPKNYHAWQHRQWVVQTFKLYDGELDYVERLLLDDVRNNSAWNQRFFLLGAIKGDVAERELNYTMGRIREAPGNESAWNYLRGLIDRCEEEESLSIREKCSKFCQDLYSPIAAESPTSRSSYLLAAMVDLHADKMELEGANMNESEKNEELEKAKKLCQTLATEIDVIRKEYWTYFDKDLTRRFGGACGSETNKV